MNVIVIDASIVMVRAWLTGKSTGNGKRNRHTTPPKTVPMKGENMGTDKFKWFCYGWLFCGLMWVGSHITTATQWQLRVDALQQAVAQRDTVNAQNQRTLMRLQQYTDSLAQYLVYRGSVPKIKPK